MSQPTTPASTPCFRFKGSSFSLTELELLDYQPDQLARQLEAQTRAMPQLFQQMPIVLNLAKLPETQPLPDLDALIRLCRSFGISPVGVQGDSRLEPAHCQAAGLAFFSNARGNGRKAKADQAPGASPETRPEEAPAAPAPPEPAAAANTRIVTHPVRSGQQLYARGGDLIILAAVGAGAEVMADGNVHVYGALRGRAMAGVCGNEQARIFCQSLEAELISIAGFFKTSEDLQSKHWNQPAQAFLQGTRLETLGL